jgi:hypothetical protein
MPDISYGFRTHTAEDISPLLEKAFEKWKQHYRSQHNDEAGESEKQNPPNDTAKADRLSPAQSPNSRNLTA